MTKSDTKQGEIKQCPKCKTSFSPNQIFNDPDIIPIGMMFLPDSPNLNCYFFNHEIDDCATTFTIKVDQMVSFIDGPIPPEIKTCTDECEKHCLDISDDRPCTADCYYAPFRLLVDRMRAAKKITVAPTPKTDEPTPQRQA